MERLLTLYSEVQSTDVRWLWYPFIAIGKITLLQGDPGDGKSTMMMNLIAELSTGGKTPDGCKIGVPQKVIYQCSEDGVSDTIKPRLERCGADCRKIAFINEEFYNGLTLDDERIRQAIIEFRPRLVVIDPIQAYLGSDSDLQIAGRARKLMRRLGMWAAGYDCAIVLIGHLNKKEGSKGLYRSLGSIDVVAAARSVLQVERDTENPDIRIVHQIKNSLAPTAEDIRFSISADKGFRWLECRPQLFEKQQPDAEPKFDTEQQKAAYWIKHFLEKGDMSANEIYCRLDNEGVSKRVARMVKTEMGIHCYQKKRKWYWSVQPEEGAMNGSVEWARQKNGVWVNKSISSLEFLEKMFRMMNWNRECRYKVLGRVANSDQGLVMLFDLEEAIMFTPQPQEFTDPMTGEVKKKQVKFFPDIYKGRIGRSYNDYVATHQMSMFENIVSYQGDEQAQAAITEAKNEEVEEKTNGEVVQPASSAATGTERIDCEINPSGQSSTQTINTEEGQNQYLYEKRGATT